MINSLVMKLLQFDCCNMMERMLWANSKQAKLPLWTVLIGVVFECSWCVILKEDVSSRNDGKMVY